MRLRLLNDCQISITVAVGMLVDIEYSSRKHNSLKRLVKLAEFEQDAYISDINYTSGRKLNREEISRLATCECITEYRNVFITGATGSDKTYLACALGFEACKQYYKTKYVRLPDLLMDLESMRGVQDYRKKLSKYTNPVLLIIDEWLLIKPTAEQRRDIFELLTRRRKKSSTIFCAQYRKEGWYEQLDGDDDPLADAILDRIIHDSYEINIESRDPSKDISMRESMD
jgi:DNA replication protein DnaC